MTDQITLTGNREQIKERLESLEVKTTRDGSPTLFVPALQEHYHSVHGAVQESQHVFIEAGLRQAASYGARPVRVLEVGFGSGLNALLALHAAQLAGLQVEYHTLEAFPLTWDIISKLELDKTAGAALAPYIKELHQSAWELEVELSPDFVLLKRQGRLEELELPENYFHVLFFDAFAPEKQPELWTEEIFRKSYACLQPNGLLVTYCAKGAVKRLLQAVGFSVDTLPGPPGKREMIRARK